MQTTETITPVPLLLEIKAEILADEVTAETIQFLTKWNQIGPLHAQFIRELASCYATQYFGNEPLRVIWPAHPGLGVFSHQVIQ
jgi:hypothetical protein